MVKHDAERSDWLSVIKGEFKEMPGLQLTKPQFRRLWGLDPAVCDDLLNALEASHFLRVNSAGCYLLADSEPDVSSAA